MSYILDALKKAEKERGRAARADLPPPFATLTKKKNRTPLWAALLAAVLLTCTGVLVLWSQPWRSQGRSSAPGEPRLMPAQGAITPGAHHDRGGNTGGASQEASARKPAFATQTLSVPSAPYPSPAADSAAPPRSPLQKPRDLRELPPSVQGGIPEITLSAHYYDNDPHSRVATVNGRVMHEGQTVSPGLTIERITPSGVDFNYQGSLFHKEVF